MLKEQKVFTQGMPANQNSKVHEQNFVRESQQIQQSRYKFTADKMQVEQTKITLKLLYLIFSSK